jgi:monoamine oxidase
MNAGMVEPARLKGVYDFSELLKSRGSFQAINFGEAFDQSSMMMEPVGGMDRVVAALLRKVADVVQLNARVEAVMLKKRGVDVSYRKDGVLEHLSADYCLNSIPLQLMAGIKHNFPHDYADAFVAVPRGRLLKLGLQARERFWEREQIYGGISWTSQEITQIWYPAHGIHRQKGVLLGAYSFGDALGEKLANLSPAERIELAIQQGEKLHPGYRGYIENGVSVAWHRMNFMLGCAANWTDELRAKWFARLQAPVGYHYMIGDQVSYHAGWQEGAIHSSLHALEDIDRRVRADANARGAIA